MNSDSKLNYNNPTLDKVIKTKMQVIDCLLDMLPTTLVSPWILYGETKVSHLVPIENINL